MSMHKILSLCSISRYLLLPDASSSNEAVHLQQRLKSLSTELVTLRNRLHVSPTSPNGGNGGGGGTTANGIQNHQQHSANSPGSATGIAAPTSPPLASSTPTANTGLQHHQQQQHINGNAAPILSTSPPVSIPCVFSSGVPIHGSSNKNNQKPTYSNQIISNNAASTTAANPIVSPRNTSIPHPLPPHVSSKVTGMTRMRSG